MSALAKIPRCRCCSRFKSKAPPEGLPISGVVRLGRAPRLAVCVSISPQRAQVLFVPVGPITVTASTGCFGGWSAVPVLVVECGGAVAKQPAMPASGVSPACASVAVPSARRIITRSSSSDAGVMVILLSHTALSAAVDRLRRRTASAKQRAAVDGNGGSGRGCGCCCCCWCQNRG